MHEVVRAAGLVGFRRLVRELGGDPPSILSAVGLDDTVFADPDRYIPYRNVLLAFETAAHILNAPDFGMRLAARQDLDFLGMLALAIQSSTSVREGLLVAARNMRYHTPSVRIDMAEVSRIGLEQVEFSFILKDLPAVPQATEHAVTHMCKIVSLLSEGKFSPTAVYFRHGQISPDNRYIEQLGVIPHFDAEFDGIALDVVRSRRQLPRTNTQLQAFVERFLIGVAPPHDIAVEDQVKETLRNLIRFQKVDLGDVARILRLHPRALQRRLKESGTKFEALLDDVRSEQASALLAQRSVPLTIVAATLGFSDQAALNRACHRWFGATPGQIRKSSASGR